MQALRLAQTRGGDFGEMKLAIILFIIQIASHSCVVVQVGEGLIAGTTSTSSLANGKIIHSFLGVPYAVPPVGKYRFKEPQKQKPWTGVWNATTLPNICAQYSQVSYGFEGDEDCLYLNVFTPSVSNCLNKYFKVESTQIAR
ncbi:hypothetical protein V9T40_012008 [Parthenolecanium corni]|uniref:Carboxylesterase type B domain-containing protein n=1 Tax=Parthenolecanium corni TaxID=536013 RepID=A0AAN9T6D5_9HEMI